MSRQHRYFSREYIEHKLSSQVTQRYENYPTPRGQNHGLHDEYRAYVTPSDMWRAPIIHFRLHRDSIQSQPNTS